MGFRTLVGRLLWSMVLLAAAEVYTQTVAPSFPNPGKTSISKDQQTALGLEAAGQVFQQMPVLPDDSPESLAARVLRVEHLLYPRVVDAVARGSIGLAADNRVHHDGWTPDDAMFTLTRNEAGSLARSIDLALG